MDQLILPTIGSSGYYELKPPFDTVVLPNERYTCQAIRSLSEYLANNEDPKVDIYDEYGIDESLYDEDLQNDMQIISLQAEMGQWVYVPASYLVKFPIVNGIPYRTLTLAAALAPLPADIDYNYVSTSVTNLIKDLLGVDAEAEFIETSKVVLISKERHDQTQSQRDSIRLGATTDRSRYMKVLQDLNEANNKIQKLEQFIKSKNLV